MKEIIDGLLKRISLLEENNEKRIKDWIAIDALENALAYLNVVNRKEFSLTKNSYGEFILRIRKNLEKNLRNKLIRVALENTNFEQSKEDDGVFTLVSVHHSSLALIN